MYRYGENYCSPFHDFSNILFCLTIVRFVMVEGARHRIFRFITISCTHLIEFHMHRTSDEPYQMQLSICAMPTRV